MKPDDIKYEPIEQEKRPIWMHSVERHQLRCKSENIAIAIMFAIVLVMLYYCL